MRDRQNSAIDGRNPRAIGAASCRLTMLGVVLFGLTLAGCSAVEPDPAGTLSAVATKPSDAAAVAGGERAGRIKTKASTTTGNGRCQEVTSWYEGFLTQTYIRDGAERELDRNLVTERARLAKRGWSDTETKDRDVYCRPSYPIGFKEWRCFGKVQLCVKGSRKG